MTRYQAHQISLNDGWRNRDEIRALEDLPPLPDGQGQVYLPVSMLGGPTNDPAAVPDNPNPIQ